MSIISSMLTSLRSIGPVTTIVILYMILSYLSKVIWEKIVFYRYSSYKYKFLNSLASYIYYGNANMGIEEVLKLDKPKPDVLKRRLDGQKYLEEKLKTSSSSSSSTIDKKKNEKFRGEELASSLVDCRFALAKVCMPILRELEISNAGRNFAVNVDTGNATNGNGMLQITTENGFKTFLGNDAVHTLGVKSFFTPVQKEINRRMELIDDNGSNEEAMLRFCPLTMNSALEENVNLVKSLTGMDKVRYSLSGSEAVDAALKDIKASVGGKRLVVRFKSAYHGHTSGISFIDSEDHVYLPECSQASLDFIEKYHYRIAAVIVNPMQHFTGINKPSPPGEKVTHSSRIRTSVSREDYALWLHSLQDKCNYVTKHLTKVAFVIDDIYFAFRTPELLSTKYFAHPQTMQPVKPDVIILGKAIAAGYPLSVVAGREGFLNSYDKKYLLKVNKTVGTFSAWHGGIIASNVFLSSLNGGGRPDGKPLLKIDAKRELSSLVSRCDAFTTSLNAQFTSANLPVRIRNFSNTFSIDYLSKSLYNSRFPQYLLAEGIFLGNYSTGKFNVNADVTKADFDALESKFVSAATKMNHHGYFEKMSSTKRIEFYFNLMVRFLKNYMKIYCDQIMEDKHIDIEVSHNHPVNKFGHFWSSIGMILFAYPSFWQGEKLHGCAWFFLTHVIRQSGHFFYEHQDRDIEKLKFGHKDASKKVAVAFLSIAAIVFRYRVELLDFITPYVHSRFLELTLEQYVCAIGLFTVLPHFVDITYEFGYLRGLSWAIKIFTDPFTDLLDFYKYIIINPKWFLCLKDQHAVYRLDIKTKEVVKVE